MEEHERLRTKLQSDVEAGRGRAQELQAKLEAVEGQLGDACDNNQEVTHPKDKQEIFETRLRYFRTGRDITVNIIKFIIIVSCIKNSTPLIFSARRNCWAS